MVTVTNRHDCRSCGSTCFVFPHSASEHLIDAEKHSVNDSVNGKHFSDDVKNSVSSLRLVDLAIVLVVVLRGISYFRWHSHDLRSSCFASW
jgi:hypothetical protein